jgi:uncharacterized membrane protein YraQ (UPF0718 family)
METVVTPRVPWRIECHWRPVILSAAGAVLLVLFWATSRYPQLFEKSHHVGHAMTSMAFSSNLMTVTAGDPVWKRVLASSVNWLDSMKIGMTFGVLLGALLHTVLRYYPLKIGNSLYINSLKGAVVGIPMGVCANCAVPTACGITRGKGRVEVALGFLFSSPNFNPVVVAMTIAAFPLSMVIAKYCLLVLVIVFVVPTLIRWFEPAEAEAAVDDGGSCGLKLPPPQDCTEPFFTVMKELGEAFGKNVWMLAKPTVTLMLLAAVLAATALVLIPWDALLAHTGAGRMGLLAVASTAMPVPIALDVMFAGQLQQQGVAPGYVMLFLTTLGTFSIIPAIYLWREVSRKLAVTLFVFFASIGWVLGMLF